MTDAHFFENHRWRSAPDDDILWAEWGDDYIAFHLPSSKTHLLNHVSKLLLTQVLQEARTTDEIVEALAELVEVRRDPAYAAEISMMLEHFDNLGLVART